VIPVLVCDEQCCDAVRRNVDSGQAPLYLPAAEAGVDDNACFGGLEKD
jgi:hypothetical protein